MRDLALTARCTVGWEPGTHPISIEKIDLFARNHFAFVAGFVFEVTPSFTLIDYVIEVR
jgi:hypothetical protein